MSVQRGNRGLTPLLVCLWLSGCDRSPMDGLRDSQVALFGLKPLEAAPYPADNPRLPERIELGRLLFYDPILSGERDVSCGTCHHPQFAFADGRAHSAGVSGQGLGPSRVLSTSAITGQPIPVTARNSPTVFNAALAGSGSAAASTRGLLFWDGRAEGLEAQATRPLLSRVEMRGDAIPGDEAQARSAALDTVLARLRGTGAYRTLFESAFPAEAGEVSSGARTHLIDSSTLARALAAFERELVTGNSPYDRYVRGNRSALGETERQGLFLFHTKAKCADCHAGPSFSQYGLVVSGVPPFGPGASTRPGDDLGREEHSGNPAQRYAFRTPSLRNVELTAPYMHNGVFSTLEDVIRYYNDGARPRHPSVSDDMLPTVLRKPLGLTEQERYALEAFLKSLTDNGSNLDPELLEVPDQVPSGLPPVLGVKAP